MVVLVLATLMPHVEAPEAADKNAPVRCAHRYLRNRLDQVDYQGAVQRELPIGSEEIESGYQYVIQARLGRGGVAQMLITCWRCYCVGPISSGTNTGTVSPAKPHDEIERIAASLLVAPLTHCCGRSPSRQVRWHQSTLLHFISQYK